HEWIRVHLILRSFSSSVLLLVRTISGPWRGGARAPLLERPDFATCCSYPLRRLERQKILGALTTQLIIETAHTRLDARHGNRVNRKLSHAQADEQRHGKRIARQRAAHPHPLAV